MSTNDIKQGRHYIGKSGAVRRVQRFVIADDGIRYVRYRITEQPALQQRRVGGIWECSVSSFARWAVREVRM